MDCDIGGSNVGGKREPVDQLRVSWCDSTVSRRSFHSCVAAQLPCVLIVLPEEDGKYAVFLEKIAESLDLPRATRREDLERAVKHYAARLEEQCLAFPYQWYNFFDFWQKPHTEK